MDPLNPNSPIPPKDPSKKDTLSSSRPSTPPLFDPTKEKALPLDPARVTPPSAAAQKSSPSKEDNLDIALNNLILAFCLQNLGFENPFGAIMSAGGVCFGISHMGIQAFLLKDIQAFDERLKKLDALFKNHNASSEEELIEYVRDGIKSDPDFLAFFEGVTLYHEGFMHTQLFEQGLLPMTQFSTELIPTVSQLVLPEKLQAKGGLKLLVKETGLYTQNALLQYLDSIKALSQKDAPPLALRLSNQIHTLSIGYDSDINKWVLIDSESIKKRRILETSDLAEHIVKAFGNQEETPITMAMYATEQESKAPRFQEHFSKWKTSQDTKRKEMLKPASLSEVSKEGQEKWLCRASIEGDFPAVQALIESGTNPNAEVVFAQTTTPLNAALLSGHLPTAEYLLTHGANPNYSSTNVLAPLCCTIPTSNVSGTKLLLESGADPNTVFHMGPTQGLPVLITALALQNPLIIKTLLEKGANPNADYQGGTPFAFAVASKVDPEIIAMMIEYKADVNAVAMGDSILDIANQVGATKEVIEMIIAAGGKSAQ